MFTGIIQAVGKVSDKTVQGGDVRLGIDTGNLGLLSTELGDSIAVNGVCLTVVEMNANQFWADVSRETLDLTMMGKIAVGNEVNLEKALTLSTSLGGHLVSGHVDGVGEVILRKDSGRAIKFVIRAPDGLARYIAHKGSICVDGISLTVNAINGCEFELTIVPHTLSETIMNGYTLGSQVNLEVDLVARYLERLLLGDKAADPKAGGIDMSFLRANGFMK
ncbi:Riboflavin synthase eubacterial/eukaryotic [hydrothermal vent metagenome]|uniref:Riboflavin synthase n=1 Tax=hydrothermal vent metagenome TaxID=652676 RepID=A0A3B0Z028_9ZZZZ